MGTTTPGRFALSLLRAEFPNEPIDEVRIAIWERVFAGRSLDEVETAVLDVLTEPAAARFFPHPGDVLAKLPGRSSGSFVVESAIARYCRLLDAVDAGDGIGADAIAAAGVAVGSVMVERIRTFRTAHQLAAGR